MSILAPRFSVLERSDGYVKHAFCRKGNITLEYENLSNLSGLPSDLACSDYEEVTSPTQRGFAANIEGVRPPWEEGKGVTLAVWNQL